MLKVDMDDIIKPTQSEKPTVFTQSTLPEQSEQPKATEPVKPSEPPKPARSSSGALKKVLAVIIVLILLAGAAYGAYKWENKRASKVEKGEQSQINDLQTQVNRLQKKATVTKSSTPSLKYLKITQLGIELPLTSSIGDLTYTWNASTSSASLGSASLQKLAEQADPAHCQVSGSSSVTTYPVASISSSSKVLPGTSSSVTNATISGKKYYWSLPGAGSGCALSPTSAFTDQQNIVNGAAYSSFGSATAIQ